MPSQRIPAPIHRFYRRADAHPDAVAVSGADGDLTYAALRREVDVAACALQQLDESPGSRVGICARNTTPHLIALLATYAAGKVWVPLSPRNGRAELDAMIAATRPTIMVTDRASQERFSISDALRDVPLVLAEDAVAGPDGSHDAEGPPTLHTLAHRHHGQTPHAIDRSLDDAQIIKFSGGSTGTPKPVVQSVRCLHAQADGLRDFFDFQAHDVNLIVAPLTHGASCFVLPILERGGRHVLLDSTAPSTVLAAIERYGVTTMYAPPTLLYALMNADAPTPSLQSLRHVIYSAAPMTPERIRDCQRFFGPVVETAYGQVEAPQIISAMRANELLDDTNLESVGRPSSVVTVGIMAPDGTLLPADTVGEIVVRGPLLMSGYLDREAETASALKDGWLHTGDLGVVDQRGYLYIRGRLRELINSGGFKIFPGDVEACLERHPAVAECAVFGVSDAKWGEAVNAAVVLKEGVETGTDELIAWVKSELGAIKAPKRVWLVSQLARNAAGKVSRAGVRSALLE
jgi:acyl-CoA synthetase (AMP-forming)/AMP-acid ligase II